MHIDLTSQFSVPAHPDVPFEAHNKAVEHQSAAQLARVKQLQKQAAQRRKTVERFKEQLQKSLGPNLFNVYTEYVARQEKTVAERLRKVTDPGAMREEGKKLQAEGEQSAKAFAGKHGIDLTRIQGLVDKMIGELGEAGDALPKRDGKVVKVVHPGDVPAAIREKKTNPWTVFRAPFAGWSWYYTTNLSGYEFRPTLHLDSGVGLIGNGNSLVAPRNDGGIYGEAEYNAAVAFWYRMPAAGLLEAWVELEAVQDFTISNMRWEYIFPWSFPSGAATIGAYLTLKVDGPRPGEWQRSWVDSYGQSFPRPGSGDSRYYPPGSRHYFNLFSDQVFAAGTWVLVQVGSLTTNACRTNQIYATSDASYRWRVLAVQVHSTGEH